MNAVKKSGGNRADVGERRINLSDPWSDEKTNSKAKMIKKLLWFLL